MANRILDDADVAVDELKRKARRRLIGAVVLALAAATLVPLLFEKEPRKLGEDVSIQIPPVDEGKFVSRLSVDKSGEAKSDGKLPAAASAESGVKGEAAGTAAASAPPNKSTAANATPHASMAPATTAASSAAPNPAASATAPESRAPAAATGAAVEGKSAPETRPSPSTTKASDATPASNAANEKTAAGSERVEGFVIQLAAFTDDKGANALANRLKKAGYPAYIEPTRTSRGTMWRVRVGGYPSRDEARSVSAQLKADGHDGLVTVVK